MKRYLQYDSLAEKGLLTFDAWASTFGKVTSVSELDASGKGYTIRQRFAKFQNLPELMTMFKETTDIKTSDMLDLPTPKTNRHAIVTQPTEEQKAMMEALAKRAEDFRNGKTKDKPAEMLLITNDGRKLGLDQRLINPDLKDAPVSFL